MDTQIKPEHFNPNVANGGGVCAHSDESSKTDMVIFSVGNEPFFDNAFKNYCDTRNIAYKEVVGCYKGIEETAFITSMDDAADYLPDYFVEDQESVLSLGPLIKGARSATLHFMDPDVEPVSVGLFRHASEKYARKQDAWTFDPSTNSYYVAE
jgi:hypothetical protein